MRLDLGTTFGQALMSARKAIIQHYRHSTWQDLRGIGNHPATRAAPLIPLIGYFILLSGEIAPYIIELAPEVAINDLGLSGAARLQSTYYGLITVSIASVLFGIACPRVVKKHGDAQDYINSEGSTHSIRWTNQTTTSCHRHRAIALHGKEPGLTSRLVLGLNARLNSFYFFYNAEKAAQGGDTLKGEIFESLSQTFISARIEETDFYQKFKETHGLKATEDILRAELRYIQRLLEEENERMSDYYMYESSDRKWAIIACRTLFDLGIFALLLPAFLVFLSVVGTTLGFGGPQVPTNC